MSKRVISLVPSSTETLLELGANVIACSKYCEQPDIAHVGGTKNPDISAIVAMRPDVVVLDREENRLEDHDALVAEGVEVFVSDVTDVAQALAVVPALADIAGVGDREAAPATSKQLEPRLTAFVPIWRRPWMTVGAATYGASVLDAVGVDVVTFGNDAYPTVTLDAVAAAEPDVVLVPSEPYEFADTHLTELGVEIPTAQVVRVDGQDLFWWGVRTPAALTRLAESLGHLPRP